MKLSFHSPIRLHDMVLKETETTVIASLRLNKGNVSLRMCERRTIFKVITSSRSVDSSQLFCTSHVCPSDRTDEVRSVTVVTDS